MTGPLPARAGAPASGPAVALALAVAAGIALRLARAPAEPSTFDEVSFLAALHRWDLQAFEPHFPGYPLAVLLARAAAALGAATPYAVTACLLLVPSAVALFLALGGTWGGATAGGLLALAPLAVSEGARPMTDATATGLLALGLVACLHAAAGGRARALAAGALLGLAAAAKPDFALFLHAAPLAAWRAPGAGRASRAFAACAGAAAVLLLATWALVEGAGGPGPLLHEALRFTRGHATDWGGGVVTAAAPLGAMRPVVAVAPLMGVAGLPALLVALPVGVLAARAPAALRRAVVLGILPYALWHLLGQNLASPRHALPLLVPLALLLGAGVDRARGPRRPGLLAGVVLLAAATGAALTEGDRGFERLVSHLRDGDRTGLRVYGGASIRPLRWRLPGLDARRVRDVTGALADLASDPCPPRRAWILKEVAGSSELPVVVDLGDASLHALPGGPHGR